MARKKTAKSASKADAAAVKENDGDTVTKAEYDKLKEDYEKLKKDSDAQKEQFLRMAAEYDNFRKRTEKEKLATFDNAVAATVEAFLPVADNFALAVASSENASDEFKKGLEMIKKQFENAFKQMNIEEFGERGDEFDPKFHNAVQRVDDDELGEDYIASVYQKGYKIGDKIIRHAMVTVAR